jgi:hypothetical protein
MNDKSHCPNCNRSTRDNEMAGGIYCKDCGTLKSDIDTFASVTNVKPKVDDGGFVYPFRQTEPDYNEGINREVDMYPGMTLRQWYAGKSLTLAHQFLKDGWCGDMDLNAESLAAVCFEIADAMIEQGKK